MLGCACLHSFASCSSGEIATSAAGSSPSSCRRCARAQREVPARGVAGQHNLVGLVAAPPQPAVAVVAVVERHPDRMLGHQPVIDDEDGRVSELRKRFDQPAV